MRDRKGAVPRETKRRKGRRAATTRRAREAEFPPARPNASRLDELGARLGAIAFTEDAVAARLRVPHLAAISLERTPVYRALLEDGPRDWLATAISLFLLQGAAPREEAEDALGAGAVEHLVATGLLARAPGGALAARASLFPCAGAYFAADHRFRLAGARPAPAEPVMYLGGDSYALAYLAPEPPAEGRALDLCTGSGVHAILAARRGGRAIGVDVNPRALAFARWNAALNGVADRCEFRRGDLYAALGKEDGAGARFDLILANPPFVPSPHGGRARLAFRDAGPTGEDVLARLLAGLPARLARDGLAAIVSVFVDERRRSFRAKLESWLGPRAALNALLVRLGADSPADYAAAQTRRPFADDLAGFEARYRRWLATLRRAEVERLSGGVLALGRHPGPTPPAFRTLDAQPPRRPDPRAIPRALDAFTTARAVVFPDEILDRRVRRPDDLVVTDEVEPRAGPLTAVRHRARLAGAIGGEVLVSPGLRVVLAEAAGRRPLRAILADIAAPAALDPADLAGRLLPDLLELAERGLLLLDGEGE